MEVRREAEEKPTWKPTTREEKSSKQIKGSGRTNGRNSTGTLPAQQQSPTTEPYNDSSSYTEKKLPHPRKNQHKYKPTKPTPSPNPTKGTSWHKTSGSQQTNPLPSSKPKSPTIDGTPPQQNMGLAGAVQPVGPTTKQKAKT
ncbi:hypothetical protein CHS0354_027780 [Potamilus streckersoni]|uniref:Uncharacterized protein n=1 Tax=Potamilus streckersoni TaxID=2493646 RepID=A0AAE0VSI8_9BIVA|nr:hypothetical protein CHS0354_027780 [Potamilus streckersoni]